MDVKLNIGELGEGVFKSSRNVDVAETVKNLGWKEDFSSEILREVTEKKEMGKRNRIYNNCIYKYATKCSDLVMNSLESKSYKEKTQEEGEGMFL